jgi:hypothetical protein
MATKNDDSVGSYFVENPKEPTDAPNEGRSRYMVPATFIETDEKWKKYRDSDDLTIMLKNGNHTLEEIENNIRFTKYYKKDDLHEIALELIDLIHHLESRWANRSNDEDL